MGLFSNIILNSNQDSINKLKPPVSIYLTKDIPVPSFSSIKKIAPLVSLINSLEPKISVLSDQELRTKTDEFRQRLQDKTKEFQSEIQDLEAELYEVTLPEEKEKIRIKLKELRNKIFEDVLPEAFGCVREASRRTVNMRHFDTQILGGVVLHEGKIAEMATGEGKTLVATLPAYLNALLGKGVHIVTVNDYLARRDAEWMGPIYEFLGLTVGVIQHDVDPETRRTAYACDITYGTNNEFGFDYLRDNMVIHKSQMVQRPFFYAIVDEVDSILIDEARTPLIISGPAEESTDKYYTLDKVVPKLKGRFILEKDQIEAKYKGEDLSKGCDYIVDEKAQTVHLTDEGETKVATYLGIKNLHEIETMEYRHHAIQALRAHNLFKKDVDYVVKDGQVIIVDEFTGRLMPGRRWSDGLHQAVEAREGLKIERENQTLATITFQNYFRMYEKLAGMTGTAFTEAEEFKQIYKLDTVVIPPNRKLLRQNNPDSVFKTEKEKFDAVVGEIKHWYELGRPVLVGTISIDKSEHLSHLLKMQGVPHQVLNAKYHELEAQIVAQAGRFKQITIATNMAGRGTDILLGGNPSNLAKNILKQKNIDHAAPEYQIEYKKLLEDMKKETDTEHKKVVELAGLHVLGTERHEARRIDNQLRGRSGRQGDPGSSRFYVSLEDDLMRLFGSDRLIGLMDKLGLEEGQVIEHPWISRSIEVAQKRVETQNFEIRKQLLEYDNVMNKQREIIYTQRKMVLEKPDLKEEIYQMIEDILDNNLARYLSKELNFSEWDIEGLASWLKLDFGLSITQKDLEEKNAEQIKEFLLQNIINAYEEKEKSIGQEDLRGLEHMVMLQIIDSKWKDHLHAMDSLKEGIGLRAYGQRDPLIEYQHEAFNMFSEMIEAIKKDTMELLFKIQAIEKEKVKPVFSIPQQFIHEEKTTFEEKKEEFKDKPTQPTKTPLSVTSSQKIGRNDPCPCGKINSITGKPLKYKKCCYPKYG